MSLFQDAVAKPTTSNSFENGEESDDEPVVALPRRGGTSVGASLLTAAKTQSTTTTAAGISKDPHRTGRSFATEQYLPPAVGGFLSAGGVAHQSSTITVGSIASRVGFVPGQRNTTPAPSSSATTAPPSALPTFRKESDIDAKEGTAEDLAKDVGALRHIFEVTKFDGRETYEVRFADGTRGLLKKFEIRLALSLEKSVYELWVRDPSSLPSAAAKRQREESDAVAPMTPLNSSSSSSSAPVEWWVIPRLHVRIVNERKYPLLVGKKFVVQSMRRPANRIVLAPVPDEKKGAHSNDADSADAAAVTPMVVVGVEDLDTVIPKKGEQALVVLGAHRGEFVTVLKRSAALPSNEEGRTTTTAPAGEEEEEGGAEVRMERTKTVLVLPKAHICKLEGK